MIAAFFGTLLAGIKTTMVLAVIGAAVGVGSLLIGRLVSGLQGYGAAAVLGAVVLVGAYGSTAFDSYRVRAKDSEIAQLKIEKAKLERDQAAQVAANAKQDEVVSAQAKQLEDDKAQMEKLEALAAKHKGDSKACVYPDELREIFRR